MSYVKVCNDDGDDIVELPLEPDNTLLLSTVHTMFPGASGLKYKASQDSESFRGLRLSEGRLYPPPEGSSNVWINHLFFCVYPKEMKRKVGEEESLSPCIQNKKVDRKRSTDLIVLGMAWKTSEETMREHFSRYGELAMVQLKRDPTTNQSKGYGFIRFTDYGAQITCLSERHNIDGRWCDVKIPNSKVEGDRQEVNHKIYIGGLPDGVAPEALKDFFARYGTVSDVIIPKPFRNFAFVTFFDPDIAQNLLGKQIPFGQNTLTIGSAAPKIHHTNRSNNPAVSSVNSSHQSMSPYSMGSQQSSVEQNTTALAALTMLNNPAVFSAVMNLAAAAQQGNFNSVSQNSFSSFMGNGVGNAGNTNNHHSSQQHRVYSGHNSHNGSGSRGSSRY